MLCALRRVPALRLDLIDFPRLCGKAVDFPSIVAKGLRGRALRVPMKIAALLRVCFEDPSHLKELEMRR